MESSTTADESSATFSRQFEYVKGNGDVPITYKPNLNNGTLVNSEDDELDEKIIYLHGVRFAMIAAVIAVMVFLTTVETTIATTSLVHIMNDLGDFEQQSWIMTSYELGYVAVMVIFAKLSDILGRKPVFLVCVLIFTAFSGGCAAAQTLTQLAINRGFQGVGGGGCFALSVIMLIECVPPSKYGQFVSYIGVVLVMATVLGPIVGGIISERTTWRWIFLFNVPIGVFILVIALFGIPNGFPFQGQPRHTRLNVFSKENLSRIDAPGFALVMAGTLSFTACFQEAESMFAWDSAYVITLLVVTVGIWAALLVWERYVTKGSSREPVLPWRFVTDRAMVGILLGFVLLGGPMLVMNYTLPQRFQLLNNLSSLDAGIRLLPFGATFPVGSVFSATICGKLQVPGLFPAMLGSAIQVVGFALFSTLPSSLEITPAVYGYEILCGVGTGMTYQILYLMVPFTAQEGDKVGMGTANQFRSMGSAFGLAITTSVFNGYIRPRLASLGVSESSTNFTPALLTLLPPDTQDQVRNILSEGYNRQMLVLTGFAAAQIPAALLLWRHKQIRIE